jgi:hypothetical protein
VENNTAVTVRRTFWDRYKFIIGLLIIVSFITLNNHNSKDNCGTAQAQTTSGQPALIDYGEYVYATNDVMMSPQQFALLLAQLLKEHPDLRVVDIEFKGYDNLLGSLPGWVIVCEPKDSSTGKQ